MVTQTFGDVLVSTTSECLSQFPSPESLKRRVILSTKPPKEYLETKSGKDEENGISTVKRSSEEAAWGKDKVSDYIDRLKINAEVIFTCKNSSALIFL